MKSGFQGIAWWWCTGAAKAQMTSALVTSMRLIEWFLEKMSTLGKKEKELSELALTERQRVEATLGPSSYLLASAHFRHKLPQGKIWFSVQGAALIPSLLALGFQGPFLHALGVPL